jgi:hypothetical protein
MALSTMLTGPSLIAAFGAVGVAAEAQLHVAGGPRAGAPLVATKKRARSTILGVHDLGEVLADEVAAGVAEERFDALVQVAEAALGVEGVDQVEGVLDHVAVHLLGGFQALPDDCRLLRSDLALGRALVTERRSCSAL